MGYHFYSYLWPLIVSGCATLLLGIFVQLRRKGVKGTRSFTISMFVVTVWSVCNALEIASLNFPAKLFWANMQYVAYCYSPVTLLSLCMEFSGYNQWVRNGKILWFAVLPTAIFLLVWTDPVHGLIRYNMVLDSSGLFPVIAKEYGPLFYVHALYAHGLNILAAILLLHSAFSRRTIYRKQAVALLLGLSLIMLPNLLYLSGLSPALQVDLTPVFFAPAGLIVTWAIFRYGMFDIIPLAWATVIETTDTGIMVLDLCNRVLNMNPAFAAMASTHGEVTSFRQIAEVCRNVPELQDLCKEVAEPLIEFSRGDGQQLRFYEARRSPLTDKKGLMIGRLVTVYDITEKKLAHQEYLRQQWIQAVTEERERMARDLHDNLAQVLGFIHFQAAGIQEELQSAKVDVAAEQLQKLADVTRRAHGEIRAYIRQSIHTPSADEDFVVILGRDIAGFEEQTGVDVALAIPPGFTGDKLTAVMRVHLLYIVREALNNIQKHAAASRVRVSISTTDANLSVCVEDDGKGFVPAKAGRHSRYGLTIMGERAARIGAKLAIDSANGKGCRITVCVPVEGSEYNHAGKSNVG